MQLDGEKNFGGKLESRLNSWILRVYVWVRWSWYVVAFSVTRFRKETVLLFSLFFLHWKYLQYIFYNYCFFILTDLHNISSVNLFSLVFHFERKWLLSLLQFSSGSFSHLRSHLPFRWRRWLETPLSVFVSGRTHVAGVWGKDAEAQRLLQPRRLDPFPDAGPWSVANGCPRKVSL